VTHSRGFSPHSTAGFPDEMHLHVMIFCDFTLPQPFRNVNPCPRECANTPETVDPATAQRRKKRPRTPMDALHVTDKFYKRNYRTRKTLCIRPTKIWTGWKFA